MKDKLRELAACGECGMTWASNKTDVTGEACAAVAQHGIERGGEFVVTANGEPALEITVRAIGTAQAEGWTKGFPTKHWADEWFIAVLKDGSRAVLRALPEEYSHDFKTADETYYTKEWVIKWMQFPDSQFITPPQPEE